MLSNHNDNFVYLKNYSEMMVKIYDCSLSKSVKRLAAGGTFGVLPVRAEILIFTSYRLIFSTY
jgi:hypothetical protein